MTLSPRQLATAKATSTHYQKTAGLNNMQKKKFKVEMIVECRPSLIEHLLEEICDLAEYENALVNQYNYYGLSNEQEEAGSN